MNLSKLMHELTCQSNSVGDKRYGIEAIKDC